MKKKLSFYIRCIMTALVVALISSCSSKLTPLSPSLFTVTPTPMEVQGTKIPVTVNGRFPEKWFNKNAEITVMPVLRTASGEQYGTSVTYQGENVAGNGITVPTAQGSSFTIKSVFDYDPSIVNPELYLRFTTHIKNKVVSLPDVKIAEGLLTTVALVDVFTTTPAEAPDDFQKLIKEAYDAEIMFLIQQAELRSNQLNSDNMQAWKQLVKDADRSPKQNVNVEVLAYSSPDGGYQLNEKLSEKREKNTTNYLDKEFKKENVDVNLYAHYTAQDWEGFKKLVEVSNLQDKDLILRVIAMYNDPADREREIKNISIIYKDLAETILPRLRRSRLIANVETIGKTDTELIQAVNTNISSLTANELLYTATLEGTPKEKIYMAVIQQYPSDYRGWNNLGAYYFETGQIDKAKDAFTKAQQLNSKSAEANMNLGLFAVADGNLSAAEQLMGGASQANTINEGLGLLYIKKGDYIKAVQAFGDAKSNNAALAQILNKNYSQAQQTLDALSNKNATSYYLEAIIAARTNNASALAHNLNIALKEDPSLRSYATNDLEFSKFLTNPSVSSLLR